MANNKTNEVENLVKNATDAVNQVFFDTVMPVVQQVVPAVNKALKEVSVNNQTPKQTEVKVETESSVKVEDVTVQETVVDDLPHHTQQPVALSLLDPLFENALQKVQKRVGLSEVTPQSLMLIVKYAMEVVELVDLKGSEQRELVLRLVRRIVQDAPISDEKEKLCLDMIDSGAVAQTIDLVIDATNGHVNVNQVSRVVEACCYSFLSSRKGKHRTKK